MVEETVASNGKVVKVNLYSFSTIISLKNFGDSKSESVKGGPAGNETLHIKNYFEQRNHT